MANKKNLVKSQRANQRSYLNKDFSAFRSELTQYGQTYFADNISDFSENGLAGMFIEMSSYIGDVMSFYLDHQFNELNILTAVESENIERLVRSSGVKIRAAAPAYASVSFYIEVDSSLTDNEYIPEKTQLPVIKAGTMLSSNSGVKFELLEDVNFRKENKQGKLISEYKTMKTDSDGNPTSFSLKLSGPCSSAITTSDSFTIADILTPFRTVTLSSPNVSEITSVKDSDGNEYFEVDALSQDTVFKRISNNFSDSDLVSENIELIPAPYRYITTTSRRTGQTTIRFGGGSADSTDDDIMPDPSDISISLFGKKSTFSRFTLDPNSLLKTRTLGIAPRNTTITIVYRAGGGISHNVSAGSIKNVSSLITKFSSAILPVKISKVRSSTEASNELPSKGGESPMTLNELKTTALAYQNSQSRIVTKADLVARIYSMPSNFGRVFRIGVRDNPNNPLASVVSIISRDTDGKLITSPDSLKNNLVTYINQFRLISDAIDIVDAQVINLKIIYGATIDPASNINSVIQQVNLAISSYMSIENFQIDQPIVQSDIVNIIINTTGVIGITNFKIVCLSGVVHERNYSSESISVKAQTRKSILYPPKGAIFEIRYPNDDIVGHAR